MRRSLELGLQSVDNALGEQADRVESMVRAAYRGLTDRSASTCEEVLTIEVLVNQSEVLIEDKCLELLALHQPVASDLRRVAAAVKINADLERIADLALDLAKRTKSLAAYPEVAVPSDLGQMVSFALELLRDADRAFTASDVALAREVCRRDDQLAEMHHQTISQLAQLMQSHPDQIPGYLHIFSALRLVQRIGDHATNIAEDVEFIVDGEITRHRDS
jgi:phosphate transport system protein